VTLYKTTATLRNIQRRTQDKWQEGASPKERRTKVKGVEKETTAHGDHETKRIPELWLAQKKITAIHRSLSRINSRNPAK